MNIKSWVKKYIPGVFTKPDIVDLQIEVNNLRYQLNYFQHLTAIDKNDDMEQLALQKNFLAKSVEAFNQIERYSAIRDDYIADYISEKKIRLYDGRVIEGDAVGIINAFVLSFGEINRFSKTAGTLVKEFNNVQ